MARARGIVVYRGGRTAAQVERAVEAWPSLKRGWYSVSGKRVDAAIIDFSINSKGGGKTEIRVCIEPSEFENLARAMFEVDPNTAGMAFFSAANEGKPLFPPPPKISKSRKIGGKRAKGT